jgi:hypothetical protein
MKQTTPRQLSQTAEKPKRKILKVASKKVCRENQQIAGGYL